MTMWTDAARYAYLCLDRRFRELQAAHAMLEAALTAGSGQDFGLYADWEGACHRFRQAHETWRALACRRDRLSDHDVDLTSLAYDACEQVM